jgi:hypothetical protein
MKKLQKNWRAGERCFISVFAGVFEGVQQKSAFLVRCFVVSLWWIVWSNVNGDCSKIR